MEDEMEEVSKKDTNVKDKADTISAKAIRHPKIDHPFDKTPHKSLHDYIMAKETIKLAYRFPEMDVARRGPEMDLVFLKREVEEAQKQLQIARRNAAAEHKKIRGELDLVGQKDLELRKGFLRFNKFICENQDKRQRFAEIIKLEEDKQKVLQQDIDDAKNKIVYYSDVIVAMKNAIEKYNIYKEFMKEVAANSSYEDISEVLNQYHAIMQTKDKISDYHLKQLTTFSDILEDFKKLQANMMPEIVQYNVKLHDLRRVHSRSKSTIEFWEGKITKMKEVVHMSHHDLSIIRALCWDMYCYLAKKRETQLKVSQDDTAAQLVYVKMAILEHRQIVSLAKILTEKESHSDIVTKGSRVTENSVISSERRPKLFPLIVENDEVDE